MNQSFTHNVERQRGGVHRVPVHHVHSLVAGGTASAVYAGDNHPEAFIGNWGSISIDTINQMLRVHDDVTPGGVLVAPLFSTGTITSPMWPFMPLQWGPVTLLANTPFTFATSFNRFPTVTVIDAATGEKLIIPTTYALDMSGFTITSNTDVTVFVVAQ